MTLEPPPGRRPPQRATDADRDHAFSILQEAHADGRLDRDELDERVEKVSVSKTDVELAGVTADLQQAAPGDGAGDQLVLRTKGSTLARAGQWSVPPHIRVEAEHARVRLDFTSAVLRHPEVLVELNCRHSSVRLVVPRGWSVTTNDLASEWSNVKDRTDSSTTGGSRLRISGLAKHGSVVVQHRRSRWWRRRL